MELSRIGSFVAVAVVAALIGAFVARSWGNQAAAGGKCDIHIKLTDHELQAIKTNLARVRTEAFASAGADGGNRDAANKAAEDSAFDTFVYNLRGPLGNEYARHRAAMDGCF